MHPQIISFSCKIMNQLGKVLSVSYNKDVINQLGDGDPRLATLIEGLQSVRAGEKRIISVPASRAYGPYDPNLSIKVDLKSSPFGKQVGMGDQMIYPHSNANDAKLYRVVEKTATHVVLEGNHPFAGVDLVYEIDIISAREAKQEDLLQQNQEFLRESIH